MICAELQLSVRSRKTLSLPGIHTLADLCSRTEAELMGIKKLRRDLAERDQTEAGGKGIGTSQIG
ncbi:MAG: DNA-directed RNA polymerase subunit alpha C-terminal domain-containing protein [Phycisphaerales bacterium]